MLARDVTPIVDIKLIMMMAVITSLAALSCSLHQKENWGLLLILKTDEDRLNEILPITQSQQNIIIPICLPVWMDNVYLSKNKKHNNRHFLVLMLRCN